MAELFTPKLAAKSYYTGRRRAHAGHDISAVAVYPVPDPGAIATE